MKPKKTAKLVKNGAFLGDPLIIDNANLWLIQHLKKQAACRYPSWISVNGTINPGVVRAV